MEWICLESNPELLNDYCYKLGMKKEWEFQDVLGLDPELLAMVQGIPQALIMVYKKTDKNTDVIGSIDKKVFTFFMQQTINDACGTVGLIHVLLNNEKCLEENSILKKFHSECKDQSPDERGKCLESFKPIKTSHQNAANAGTSSTTSIECQVYHFVSFIEKDGVVYEMDGRKSAPINHGKISTNFMSHCAQVVKKFITLALESDKFSLICHVKKY